MGARVPAPPAAVPLRWSPKAAMDVGGWLMKQDQQMLLHGFHLQINRRRLCVEHLEAEAIQQHYFGCVCGVDEALILDVETARNVASSRGLIKSSSIVDPNSTVTSSSMDRTI